MTTTELAKHYRCYATHPEWEYELRWSVRLHLALSEPGLSLPAVLVALRLVEANLYEQLLDSDPASAATPKAANIATSIVQVYQTALLNHEAECKTLRRTFPITDFISAPHPSLAQRAAPEGGWSLPE